MVSTPTSTTLSSRFSFCYNNYMKKKILLIIVAFFLAGFISFGVMLGLRIDNDSKKSQLFTTAMADYGKAVEKIGVDNVSELDDLAKDIKCEGGYALVEKAVKEYTRDVIAPYYEAGAIQKDSIYTQGITGDFLQKNMPDFTAPYATISKMSAQLDKLQNVVDKKLTRDEAMKYLDDDLDEEYIELYENEVKAYYEDAVLSQKYTTYIQKFRPATEQYQKILDFLVANKGKWHLKDDVIVFSTTSLTNQYNALAAELNALNQ